MALDVELLRKHAARFCYT